MRKIEIGKEDSYNEALTLLANQNGKEDYLKAIELLTSISDYKDSEKNGNLFYREIFPGYMVKSA